MSDKALQGDLHEPRILREEGLARRVADIVEPVIADLGYRLVLVVYSGKDGGTLEIMAERPDGRMKIEDCEMVSHAVSPVLDLEDPIEGHYMLQVSSPGIDRHLVRRSDFDIWAGHVAKLELAVPIEGRRRFRGVLKGTEGANVLVEVDAEGGVETRALPMESLASAKLVLTDALIEAAGALMGPERSGDDSLH